MSSNDIVKSDIVRSASIDTDKLEILKSLKDRPTLIALEANFGTPGSDVANLDLIRNVIEEVVKKEEKEATMLVLFSGNEVCLENAVTSMRRPPSSLADIAAGNAIEIYIYEKGGKKCEHIDEYKINNSSSYKKPSI